MNRTLHRVVFAVCAGMLLAAVVLAVVGDVGPSLRVFGMPLPVSCGFLRLTGLPCAGCGLTRSWVSLAFGDLHASLAFHRLGWLVMAYVAAQAVRHGAALLTDRRPPVAIIAGRWLDLGMIALMVALMVNWAFVIASLL